MIQKKAAYFLILVLLFSVSVTFAYAKPGTCKNPNGGNYCNSKSQVSDCACDAACGVYGDCCDDYKGVCDSSTVSGKQLDSVSNTPPLGNLDAANCDIIGGWAIDMDTRSAAIAIHVYKDGPAGSGTFVTASTTTGLRQDINNIYDDSSTVNTHGFTIATPDSLKDGKSHDIYIHGIDSTTPAAGPNPVLSGTPKKIQCEKAPTANITANDADSIIAVPYGSSVKITWTSTDAKSCDVYRGTNVERGDLVWSDTGNTRYATITSDTVFRLICTGPGGTASDEITVRPSNLQQCKDSDADKEHPDGKNYYVKGTTTGDYQGYSTPTYICGANGDPACYPRTDGAPYTTYYDVCQNNQLDEGYCSEDGKLMDYGYPCPNGCKDGACLVESGKYDLFDYPNIFIKGNSFNGVLVVGDKASNNDVLAMSDIISGLKNVSVGPVKLASEVGSIEQNILSVGGACANAITSQIEGYPQDCTNGLQPGVGKINLYTHNGYAHLVVKGYYDSDTSAAANVLANYKDYKLIGVEYTVNSPVCTDSDGGIDYYVKGYVSDQYTQNLPEGKLSDSCSVKNSQDNYDFTTSCEGNNCFIVEYYCYGSDNHDTSIVACPNGCKDGACIQDFPPSCAKCAEIASGLTTPYFDPTRCHSMIFNGSYSVVNDYFAYTAVQCESNQFVGGVTHINCPSYYTDSRVVVGTAWYENSLPYLIEYTCADQTGNLNAPSDILAYCCDITSGITTGYGDVTSKADVVSTQKRHSITVNKQGKITVT